MASRRMFARSVTDSDAFLDIPLATQALYLHLCMNADDDGLVNNPKRIARAIGSNTDEVELLAEKGFVISFKSGVICITHWKVHNYIPKDRYNPSVLPEKTNYCSMKRAAYTVWIRIVYKLYTQVRLV